VRNILMVVCIWLGVVASSFATSMNTNGFAPFYPIVAPSSRPPVGTGYGPWGLLDHRSDYGVGIFPEPFLVDDSDYEPGEARLDWLHTRTGTSRTDIIHPEVEMGFDQITFELEAPYELDTEPNAHGFDNVDLGARGPLYQYVSPGGLVNTTFGAGFEAGIPTESAVSKNAELVPKLFNDFEIGNFTIQSIFGYSTLFGPGEESGLQTFEYGFVFGYTIQHEQLAIPDVLQTIPVFELIGNTEMNKQNPGHNSLLADAGFRFNLKPVGQIQPRPGIAFVFPLNSGARESTHWGIMTSVVFEF
jgi:hypothetical protein